jgi:hypothetical protein
MESPGHRASTLAEKRVSSNSFREMRFWVVADVGRCHRWWPGVPTAPSIRLAKEGSHMADRPRQEVILPGDHVDDFVIALGVSVDEHVRTQVQDTFDRIGELERLSDARAAQIQLH